RWRDRTPRGQERSGVSRLGNRGRRELSHRGPHLTGELVAIPDRPPREEAAGAQLLRDPDRRPRDRAREFQQVPPLRQMDSTPTRRIPNDAQLRSEEHTSELQSRVELVFRLLLEK